MDLNTLWFILIGVLLTGYAVLDGFDLGVGILHPIAKDDTERRIFMNSIGPLWDGNEVWLVTFGGALFAAFPHAYATSFSGFYLPFMFVLFSLIFRAVSMEFRSKHSSPVWRKFWDICFFLASTSATVLFGIAIGNCMLGLPIGSDMEYQGNFVDLLRPFPVMVGVFAVTLFAMHGSIYLYLKTEGKLQERLLETIWTCFGLFLVCYLFTTIYTLSQLPQAIENFKHYPWAWFVVFLNILAIANIPRAIYQKRPLYAFLSSCATIIAFNVLFGLSLFPNLIVSNLDPSYSLTIYNAASSQKTLGIMRWVAVLGMPFVITYTVIIYWIFRGKVQIGKFSY